MTQKKITIFVYLFLALIFSLISFTFQAYALENDALNKFDSKQENSAIKTGGETNDQNPAENKNNPKPEYLRPDFLKAAPLNNTSETLILIAKESAANPELFNAHLKELLFNLLNHPETFNVKFDGMKQNGVELFCPTIDVSIKNAIFDELKVETASIILKNISFDLMRLFNDGKLRVISQDKVFVNINIAEEDLNQYLIKKSEKIKVRKPFVNFEKERLNMGGTFKYGLFVISFTASGVFKIIDNSKIHFDIKRMTVNSMKMPRNFVRKVLDKINPIMDLDKFPFKLIMKSIIIKNHYLTFSSE